MIDIKNSPTSQINIKSHPKDYIPPIVLKNVSCRTFNNKNGHSGFLGNGTQSGQAGV